MHVFVEQGLLKVMLSIVHFECIGEQWYCIPPLLCLAILPSILLAQNNMPSSLGLCDWLEQANE